MSVHPVIRILLILATALFLPFFQARVLFVFLAVLLASIALYDGEVFRDVLRAFKRVRMLIGAIVFAFVAFPLIQNSVTDLSLMVAAGVHQVLYLLAIVTVVALVNATTPAETLAAALARLLSPLALIGFDVQRAALRFALTLSAYPELERALKNRSTGTGKLLGDRAGRVAAALIRQVEMRAEKIPPATYHLPVLDGLCATDWLVLTLIALFSSWLLL